MYMPPRQSPNPKPRQRTMTKDVMFLDLINKTIGKKAKYQISGARLTFLDRPMPARTEKQKTTIRLVRLIRLILPNIMAQAQAKINC
jgi:hypothetical protein